MNEVFVVFGAAVWPDGSPSATLRRRTLGALALSERGGMGQAAGNRRFLLTGGQGRHGPPEAHVMRDLLVERGVPEHEIELEDRARDTLESVLRCARLLRAGDRQERIVVATSGYHAYRCWLLFRLLGIRSRIGSIPSDRSIVGLRGWIRAVLRECVATPWDALLLLAWHRNERLARR